MIKTLTKQIILALALVTCFSNLNDCFPSYSIFNNIAQAQKRKKTKQFKNSEVRIIRPRYFNKRMRLELGLNSKITMNQSFIYTFQAGASLGFHFTESIGLELSGSYGFSRDKNDKTILRQDPNDISTKIIRTKWDGFANLMWTPIYGKFQMTSGKLIYMDTFLLAGVGAVGVEYFYDDRCNRLFSDEQIVAAIDAKTSITDTYTPGFGGGIGQRIFISQKTAIRWDARIFMFNYVDNHSECTRYDNETRADYEETTSPHTVVNIQLGVSYFL